MKIINLTIFLFVTFFATHALGQSQTQAIRSIENTCKEIKKSLRNFSKTEEVYRHNGKKTFYMLNGQIQKATLTYTENASEINSDYYFSNGKLIHFEKTARDTASKKLIDIEKMYVHEGELILWSFNDKQVDKERPEFKKAQDDLSQISSKILHDIQRK
jgi:hypothetical protein